MSASETEGRLRNVAGKVEETVGRATGDEATEMRGKVRQVAGQAQEAVGEAVHTVRDFTAHQPIMAVLLAAGVGLIAGMLMGRR